MPTERVTGAETSDDKSKESVCVETDRLWAEAGELW